MPPLLVSSTLYGRKVNYEAFVEPELAGVSFKLFLEDLLGRAKERHRLELRNINHLARSADPGGLSSFASTPQQHGTPAPYFSPPGGFPGTHHHPVHIPPFEPFEILKVRAWHPSDGDWTDVAFTDHHRAGDLKDWTQLYVFQRDSAWHREASDTIPPPDDPPAYRMPGDGFARLFAAMGADGRRDATPHGVLAISRNTWLAQLSRGELNLGLSQDFLLEVFRRGDRDGDGFITADESGPLAVWFPKLLGFIEERVARLGKKQAAVTDAETLDEETTCLRSQLQKDEDALSRLDGAIQSSEYAIGLAEEKAIDVIANERSARSALSALASEKNAEEARRERLEESLKRVQREEEEHKAVLRLSAGEVAASDAKLKRQRQLAAETERRIEDLEAQLLQLRALLSTQRASEETLRGEQMEVGNTYTAVAALAADIERNKAQAVADLSESDRARADLYQKRQALERDLSDHSELHQAALKEKDGAVKNLQSLREEEEDLQKVMSRHRAELSDLTSRFESVVSREEQEDAVEAARLRDQRALVEQELNLITQREMLEVQESRHRASHLTYSLKRSDLRSPSSATTTSATTPLAPCRSLTPSRSTTTCTSLLTTPAHG
ncbi:hypothetical protein DIPPA_03501 [Diplonema papillatum]|nr:hypothetical protein DIPPA_03501 [Diplonema papillatum]|eukprot:gene9696-15057_t